MDIPRHVKGREAFAAFLDQWIKASTLSLSDWASLGRECLGVGKLNPTQLSGLRTGVTKQVGVYMFESLAAINGVAWKHHREGKSVNTHGMGGKIAMVPPLEVEGEAADTADLVFLYLGVAEPPSMPDQWLEAKVQKSAPVDMSKTAGRAIRQSISRKGFTDPLDGFAAFVGHYPTGDLDRLSRLKEVCFGLRDFTAEELDQELAAICIALRDFTGDGWSPRRIAELGVRQAQQ